MKAIISGASKGIGKATAIAMAKAGYDLILISRNEDDLKSLKNTLLLQDDKNIKVEIHPIDLSSSADLKKLSLAGGREDQMVLVNNVGSYQNEELISLGREDIDKMLAINLYGSIELTELSLPLLQNAKKSQIINISSINGLHADSAATAYSISKHALKAWNDALRDKLRKQNIKVTAFYPGPVNTSSWEGMELDQSAMIQANDIANLILQVCSLSEGALVEEIKITPLNFHF